LGKGVGEEIGRLKTEEEVMIAKQDLQIKVFESGYRWLRIKVVINAGVKTVEK
jgi:hypothetical protein